MSISNRTSTLIGLILSFGLTASANTFAASAKAITPHPTEIMTATEQIFSCQKVTQKLLDEALKQSPEIMPYTKKSHWRLRVPLTFWGQRITHVEMSFEEGYNQMTWGYTSPLPISILGKRMAIPAKNCQTPAHCNARINDTDVNLSAEKAGTVVTCYFSDPNAEPYLD